MEVAKSIGYEFKAAGEKKGKKQMTKPTVVKQPTYTLHKLPEGFIVTDSLRTPNLKKGELCLDEYNQVLPFVDLSIVGLGYGNIKKVIAQQHQLDFSALKEEEQKEIGWFDVEKLALQKWENLKRESITPTDKLLFQNGYEHAFKDLKELLSNRRFTLEQVREALEMTKEIIVYPSCANRDNERKYSDEEIVQYLSKQSWNVKLEMEWVSDGDEEHDEGGTLPGQVESYQQPKFTSGKVKILKLL